MRNNIKINIKGWAILGIATLPFLGNAQTQDTSYKIGINTENPNATLHIVGEKNGTEETTKTKAFEVSNGSDNATRKILFTAVDNGRVGIGAENPQADLHIKGDGTNPAIVLERAGVGTKNFLPFNYDNNYNVSTSFGYIGKGLKDENIMQVIANEGNAVLRSESAYGDAHYTEILNKKTDNQFEISIRKGNETHKTSIKDGSWKIAPYSNADAVNTENSLNIEGAIVLKDGGYNPADNTNVPAQGTMIFYKAVGQEEGSFWVYTSRGWKKLDNN